MKLYKKYIGILFAIPVLLISIISCDDSDFVPRIVDPNAEFTFNISTENPLIVNFTSVITDREYWEWDFGDGESSSKAHPSHTYAKEGNYKVTLTAYGEAGSTPKTVEQEVTVELFEPTASFTYLSGTEDPLELKFTAITQYATAYSWDFGDGTKSTDKNPSHVYGTEGEYKVTLTVTGFPGTTPVVVSETVNAGVALVKLVGVVFGHESSWGDNPDTYVTAAFDDNLSTFVDAPQAEGHAGYDFGVPTEIMLVKYAPRDGYSGRMLNGEFRGSNDPDYLNTFDVLHTITEEPNSGELSEVGISGTYRYFYFYSTDYCNIAELQFFGVKAFAAVSLDNADFELPASGKLTNWEEVPGWSTDSTAADSGIENQEQDGNWLAYKMSSDPEVYQTTDHTIATGEEIKVELQAWDTWNSAQFTVTLYFDSGDGTRNVIASQTFDINGDRSTLEMVAKATGDSVGAKLGVSFDNISTDGNDGWSGFDNVKLFTK